MHSANLTTELLSCERKYWQAIKERDLEAAIQLTDFPCILAGAQGIMSIDQTAFTRMMQAPPSYVIHSFELDDTPSVRLVSDDVAVVAYKVHEELTVDGKSVSVDAADSSTWVRRNGHWRCALHTEAIAGDPFGRDRVGGANRVE